MLPSLLAFCTNPIHKLNASIDWHRFSEYLNDGDSVSGFDVHEISGGIGGDVGSGASVEVVAAEGAVEMAHCN